MKTKNLLFSAIFFSLFLSVIFIAGCNKKEEQPQTFIPPPQETSSDKEKELKEKEEFLRLKEEELKKQGLQDTVKKEIKKDSISAITKDTSKTKTQIKKEEQKKKFTEKEKELNKKFSDPKAAVKDYLEFIKRGVSEDGSFDGNMKKANEVWSGSSLDKFKANYKNTKKFVMLTEPELVSQKGSTAVIKVKVKKTDKVKSKEVESDLTVTYNLVADANGKWKIKSNTVKKN
ncbi:MAG: hypothetical protein J0M18_14380 [Ignavibacteria bacterium]|jgi:hypothetical protein|nr:hypothetical protein [Ignavibacteria bacterium]